LKNIAPGSALAGIALLFSASAASATVIDVQFSASSPSQQQIGAAVIGAAGDYWNYFNGASGAGKLVDTSQAATGISLTFAADGAYTANSANTAFTNTPYANLEQGILYTSGSGIKLTLTGLSAGQQYSLYFYTQGDNNSAGRSSTVDVNGLSEVSTQTNASTFIQGNNYLVFSGAADSLGDLSIGVSNRVGEADVNGFQLAPVIVPEPASFALVGAGLAVLGGFRLVTRRRPAA